MFNTMCTLHYANRSMYGVLDINPGFFQYKSENRSLPNYEFQQVLATLFERLRKEAAQGGSLLKFASGNANLTESNQTNYALAQCTPDLSLLDCRNCLFEAFINIEPRSVTGMGYYPSCNFRFEVYKFFDAAIEEPSNTTYIIQEVIQDVN